MEQPESNQADTTETRQQTTSGLLHVDEPQQGHSGGNSSSDVSSSSWRQRLVRYSIKVIQAVLLIELAAMVVQPMLPAPLKSEDATSDSDEQGFDPADILMDYFTGRRGAQMQHGLAHPILHADFRKFDAAEPHIWTTVAARIHLQ
jgi:hypothetical protein